MASGGAASGGAAALNQRLAPRPSAARTYADDLAAVQVARRPLLMQPAAAVKNVDCHRAELLANCVTCLAYECVARNAGRRARDAGMLGDEAAHRRLRPVAPVMRCTAALAAIYHLTGLDRYHVRERTRRADLIGVAAMASISAHASGAPTPQGALLPGAVAMCYQPFAVAAVQAARAQVALARRASRPAAKGKKAHLVRGTVLGALGLGFWVSEDKYPGVPYLHATWHILSAAGMWELLPVCAA